MPEFGVETEIFQVPEPEMFLPYFYPTRGRQWGRVLLPDEETLHKPEGWSFTEGSVQRSTRRESSQNRVYTSHIRGVSPTEAWRTEEMKALLFTHSETLPQHPETKVVADGHMGSLHQPLHFRQFHWWYIEDYSRGSQETLMGRKYQLRGRSSP